AVLTALFTSHAVLVLSRITIVWGDENVVDGRKFRHREKALSIVVGLLLILSVQAVFKGTTRAVAEFQVIQQASDDSGNKEVKPK
ncbi:MAG: hypothetical protein WCD16_07100, partial [Paracoccaceae bacterium]